MGNAEKKRHSPGLLEFLKVVETFEHDLFARLFDLAGEEHLVKDCVDLYVSPAPYYASTHLVEGEDKVELAHVLKKGV
jgi:hypothetical protein